MKIGREEQPRTNWEGGVFFCDGKGWGVREIGKGDVRELRSVCLGTEEEIRKSGNGLDLLPERL